MGSGIDKRNSPSRSITCWSASGHRRRCPGARTGGYDVIPANRDLAGAEIELVGLDRAKPPARRPRPAQAGNTTSS